jgi:hypothetical protein
MTQSQIDNLVNRNPDVVGAKLNEGMLGLEYMDAERALKKAEDSGDEEAISKAEQFRASVNQALELAKINAKSREASTAITASSFENPQEYLNYEQAFLAKREAEAQKAPSADQQAADNFLAATGAAGTTTVTPKQPVELNFFEQSLLEEAPAKRKELEESSNQWASAKQSIRGALGAGKNDLEKIALEVFKADVLGKGLPFVKARLIERIANEVGGRIPQGTKNAPIKFGLTDTAFSQKSYRLGPNAVTWYEVIGTIADDLISQYEKAQIGANAPTTNTSLENKNPNLGAVSAIPVP